MLRQRAAVILLGLRLFGNSIENSYLSKTFALPSSDPPSPRDYWPSDDTFGSYFSPNFFQETTSQIFFAWSWLGFGKVIVLIKEYLY